MTEQEIRNAIDTGFVNTIVQDGFDTYFMVCVESNSSCEPKSDIHHAEPLDAVKEATHGDLISQYVKINGLTYCIADYDYKLKRLL